MSSHKKTVLVVCGPTAVGKTSIAISLAKQFHTEILSADSRQCFRELNIGVARPSEQELKEVPHHFIASHSILENVNSAFFQEYGLHKVHELFQIHDTVVMVGGTGLYIKAFCEGLDQIPDPAPEVRHTIMASYQEKGLRWLQDELKRKDPKFYAVGEIENPQRVMRALEIVESTGRSILSFQKNKKEKRPFNIRKIGLELPKEELHQNINLRVDKMMSDGLVPEVSSLKAYQHVNALQTVGYTELFKYLDGEISLATAVEEIKRNTRRYAKRQMTWFKKDKDLSWINAKHIPEIIAMAQKLVDTSK